MVYGIIDQDVRENLNSCIFLKSLQSDAMCSIDRGSQRWDSGLSIKFWNTEIIYGIMDQNFSKTLTQGSKLSKNSGIIKTKNIPCFEHAIWFFDQLLIKHGRDNHIFCL